MAAVEFRTMQAGDLPDVLKNERRCYTHPWNEGIFRDCLSHNNECWLLVVSDQVIGHGIVSLGAGEAHLLNICVHPECQGNGYGRSLVGHLLGRARAREARTIFLEVRASNLVAYNLYEALGFNEVGLRENYYPAFVGREDARVLAKELLD